MRAHSQVWWFFSSILTLPCGARNSWPGQPLEDQRIGVGRLHLRDRLGEEVGLEVGGFHHRVGHRVLAVFRLVALDEGLVLRRVDALEVVERGVVTDRILRPHRRDFLLGGDRRADRDILGGDAEFLELLVEGDDLVADQIGEDDIGTAEAILLMLVENSVEPSGEYSSATVVPPCFCSSALTSRLVSLG